MTPAAGGGNPMAAAVGQQLGAAVDALEGAIRACPEDVWTSGPPGRQPWYLAFHTLFWLDLYLSESTTGYRPPSPFTRSELEPDAFPERAYERGELLAWLPRCREALAARLATVGDAAGARRPCRLHWGEIGAFELLLYNLRHVQHHTAQINLLVRQAGGEPGSWVLRAGPQ